LIIGAGLGVPLYEYQCKKCKHRFEKIQSFSDAPIKKCPSCGANAVEKLLSAPAVHFKGSGFYVTDYAKKSSTEGSSSGESKGESKSTGKDGASASADSASSGKTASETKVSEKSSESKSAPAEPKGDPRGRSSHSKKSSKR
jgi:putative FmdB family regulatory protein